MSGTGTDRSCAGSLPLNYLLYRRGHLGQPLRAASRSLHRIFELCRQSLDGLDSYFLADSPLSAELSGFSHRPEQLEMARLVVRAMSERRHLAVEAGAGTGKTLAYLIPALLSGRTRHRGDRHQDAAGPAVPPRPAAREPGHRPAGGRRATEGARQLSVPYRQDRATEFPDQLGRAAAPRSASRRAVGGADAVRGRRRGRRRRRGLGRLAARDVHGRELSWRPLPEHRGVPRRGCPQARRGLRSRGGESPPARRRHDAEG